MHIYACMCKHVHMQAYVYMLTFVQSKYIQLMHSNSRAPMHIKAPRNLQTESIDIVLYLTHPILVLIPILGMTVKPSNLHPLFRTSTN